ncbi:hypothetical protein CB1_000328018 [Camelus ferus]|nr:hypothetical protein CB1_000328018 [Camelus ferus]
MRLGSGAFAACCVVIEGSRVVSSSILILTPKSPLLTAPVSFSVSYNFLASPTTSLLLRSYSLVTINAHAQPSAPAPTIQSCFCGRHIVWLPRGLLYILLSAKALMTGSLPGFIDVVRNLNSPTLLEDSVISRARAAGKRIVFYGDETWVDDNVTRHLDKVLKRRDWDMLILHYLGLDHIGHISGPSSPLIGHKLSEMDGVLMKVHTSLLSEERETLVPNLLVLCADHGMAETGGHGASSPEEVNTPLVLISSAFGRKHDPGFEQFKVSERLHGNWIRLYLEESSSEVLFNLGSKLRRQYLDALRTLSLSLSRQMAQYDVYSMVVGTVVVLEVLTLLLLSVPQALSSKAELDVPLLSPVFSLLFYLVLLVLSALHVIVCTSAGSRCYLCSLSWPAAGGVMVLISTLLCAVASALAKTLARGKLLSQTPAHPISRWSELDLLILLGTVGHVLSLGASSFVEEEHQTWYFLINTLCLALCHEVYRSCFLGDDCGPQHCLHAEEEPEGATPALQAKRADCNVLELDAVSKGPSSVEVPRGCERWMVLASPWLVLTCCRLLRSLNQTGVQWAHRPDLGHWLTRSASRSGSPSSTLDPSPSHQFVKRLQCSPQQSLREIPKVAFSVVICDS